MTFTFLRRLSSRFAGAVLRFALGLVLLGAAWELLRRCGVFERELLPAASAIVATLTLRAQATRFWADVGYTLYRALGGLGAAVVVGVPVGLFIGSFASASRIAIPLVDALRSIPVTSLYPMFVLTLGIGDRGKMGMVFYGCCLIAIFHAAIGFDRRSRVRYDVARLYGASRAHLLWRVSVIEALPQVLTGTRISVGLALIISTLTEMFMGASLGMGQSIMESYSIYDLTTMYAYILALGIVGFGLNSLFVGLEEQTRHWSIR